MLSLGSLAPRPLHAEASHQAPQTRVPHGKWLPAPQSSGACGEARHGAPWSTVTPGGGPCAERLHTALVPAAVRLRQPRSALRNPAPSQGTEP